MAARAISSGTLSFGLVAIPIKLYTAASSEQIRFNMLHEKCGGRVKQQYHCPVDEEVISRSELVKGYEYAKGQYVTFSNEEIKALESERSPGIEISEFVPLGAVDLVQLEKAYYLGPDKGGDKPYRLLSDCMAERGVVAIGKWNSRGKEQLVLIRPFGDGGLALHQLYYGHEIREFDAQDSGATFQFSDVERELALKLIDELTHAEFEPAQYESSFQARLRSAIDEKVAGKEITVAPEAPKAQIVDLFEALKKSLAEVQDEATAIKPPKKTRGSRATKKKKAASDKS